MVLDKLGSSLRETLSKITGAMFVDEKLINELVKDIQRALLQSDVNVKLVFELAKSIKERALSEKTPPSLTKKEHLVKIVYDELVKFLGGDKPQIKIDKKPFVIMLVGLFGSGKTTTAGKLGKYYKKRGLKVALVQTDTWRPAAYKQLKTLGDIIGVDVYGDPNEKDPVKIYSSFLPNINKYDLIIVDTAGRDALSEELVEELNKINKIVQPNEVLLVLSADIGQAAEAQARKFHETVHVTGVVISKLDGTAKGGGALIACSITDANVKFIGTGEKIDDLELFNPQRFVGRLLGMGDLESLLEKAKEAINKEEAADLGKKLLKGEFNLIDLYEQMKMMKKMGPLQKVIEMIPGFSTLKLPKEALVAQEGKLEAWRHIMDSMTKEELEEPEKISGSRVERIARGSGKSAQEVRELIKQFKKSKKMMKMLKGKDKNMEKMMKKLQSGQIKGF